MLESTLACVAPVLQVQGVLSSAAELWPHVAISDSLVMADTAVCMAKAGCRWGVRAWREYGLYAALHLDGSGGVQGVNGTEMQRQECGLH